MLNKYSQLFPFVDVFKHVQDRFSINIPKSLPITFIHIPPMTVATTRRFTLIVESMHSMKLAYNALCQFTPDVYIDTTGCAFTFLVAKILANCKVLAYVHYPTISTVSERKTSIISFIIHISYSLFSQRRSLLLNYFSSFMKDMLNLVWERRPTYNNISSISQNKVYTYIKLLYYIIFAFAYGLVGSLADIILVNSTWTFNHITYLWRFYNPFYILFQKKKQCRKKIHVVYPPCDITSVDEANTNENNQRKRNNCIVSIGQFRPEKDHTKQIQSFATFVSKYNDIPSLPPREEIKLLLIGSCRNEFDYRRVEELQTLAYETLGLTKDQVQFIINEPYPVLLHHMSSSLIGIHTMWNEHFGISVVEMMSNGLITIGHDSGGPKSDIISVTRGGSSDCSEWEQSGFLAHTEDEYVQAMIDIYQLEEKDKHKIRHAAKLSCERFSDEVFMHAFKHYLLQVI